MDVIDALVSHHAVLRQLYQQSETNPDVFDQFLRNLVVHHTMEEKYFYDLLEGHVRLEEIFLLIDSMPMRQDEMRQKGRKF